MFRFLLKLCILVSVLFFGVILGYQEANDGLRKMKGYDDPRFKDALTVEEKGSGDYEVTILGEAIPTHNLDEKKKVLEEMKSYNFLTNIAKEISNGVTKLFSFLHEKE